MMQELELSSRGRHPLCMRQTAVVMLSSHTNLWNHKAVQVLHHLQHHKQTACT